MNIPPKRLRRAEMFANGMTRKDIAQVEGVSVGLITANLRGVVWRACAHATEGSPLPRGVEWITTLGGITMANIERKSRATTVDQVKWALAVLQQDEPHLCDCCGRPL